MNKNIKNDKNDVPVKRKNNEVEERDTSGDTKVFQIISKVIFVTDNTITTLSAVWTG